MTRLYVTIRKDDVVLPDGFSSTVAGHPHEGGTVALLRTRIRLLQAVIESLGCQAIVSRLPYDDEEVDKYIDLDKEERQVTS